MYDYTHIKEEGQYEIFDGAKLVGTAIDLRHARMFSAAKDFQKVIYKVRDALSLSGPPHSPVAIKCIDIIDRAMSQRSGTHEMRRNK